MKATLAMLALFVCTSALAEELNAKYCADLRAAKANIESQQRQRSTQSLRDQHKYVSDQLYSYKCKW
ncbi:hypothetical protein [Chitinolyticbacter meiyuanensis]|uniref:hypothetical protein n=1 Tax=Chitinolyticbacter meiyuanensis TaxID=682798 RepID=UPI0011E5D716|nr:hypothetical protein [Chitinolyticbacter meiyuanensis]